MIDPVTQSIEDILSQLSPRDQKALVSLPYRAGLYVSFSDTSGGWEAQEAEMQSLTSIMRQYSEDYCKGEFAQKVLMETLRQRQNWPTWSHAIDGVPREAREVVVLLKPLLADRQLASFKEVMVDIAISVAMAFHEDGNDEEAAKPSLVRGIIAHLLRTPPDPLEHMNISASERAALTRLCNGLGYTIPQR